MFYLTMATSTGVVSPQPPLSAPDALRTWEAEEPRWFRVICLDQDHNLVAKGELRTLVALAQGIAGEESLAGGLGPSLRPSAVTARVGMGQGEAALDRVP